MAKKKAARGAGRAAGKPVRNATRKAADRARTAMKKVARRAASARKSARTAMKKAARTTAKKTASMKKAAARQVKAAKKQVKAATKRVDVVVQQARAQHASVAKSASNAIGKAATLAKSVKAGVTAALTPPAAPKTRHKRPPSLDRERRTVQEIHGAPSSLGAKPPASAAKSGRDDLRHKLERHTSSSPALTAGDVDADWESADSSGDEAPGGDNPTPDQDVVDEIGRALGVEYDDDEELQGGDEIASRDRHRWELDPGSAEDSDDRD